MKCELRDHCSLYLLGLLEAPERTMYEQHLLQGCEECSSELATLGEPLEVLAMTEKNTVPSPVVKERLMALVRKERNNHGVVPSPQVWKEWQPVSLRKGLTTLRSDEGRWEEIGIEGINVKQLFADPEQRTITMLVRMAAGTAYPSHRHAGVEECYVLEGDLHVGDELVLHAGDYQRADMQSVHLKQWTENGCLLFIVSSTEDQLLE
ncbi:MAG: hypothetical protein EPO24_12745 [Bacteroidetes bacterium]|nr:MAG: hypothetical protein EPO24_12745 [Bacteroidota bacterium]